MAEIQQLERSFRYNSVDLPDPGAQYTTEQVRDFYAATYPEIVSAAVEGPEEKDGKLVWSFRKAVGTKGNLLTGQSSVVEEMLLALGAPRHVTDLVLRISARELAVAEVSYYPEEKPLAGARPVFGKFNLVERGSGAGMIAAERHRQIKVEGWTAQHDDGHADHSLAMAAAVYAAPEPIFAYRNPPDLYVDAWPATWDHSWDKRRFVGEGLHTPAPAADYPLDERIALLAKSGALIAAEIDRLQRMQMQVATQRLQAAKL